MRMRYQLLHNKPLNKFIMIVIYAVRRALNQYDLLLNQTTMTYFKHIHVEQGCQTHLRLRPEQTKCFSEGAGLTKKHF